MNKLLAVIPFAFLLEISLANPDAAIKAGRTGQAQPAPAGKVDLGAAFAVHAPADCKATEERAGQLLKELDPKIPADVWAEAEAYTAKPPRGSTLGKAWDDFAGGASLLGGRMVAAWAGLRSVQAEWTRLHATNCGIYLYHFGKRTEALQFLNCAYSMGSRSPFLLEALATVNQSMGNSAEAKQFIQQARAAAPQDRIINIEASLATTGGPPPPVPPPPADEVKRALQELEAHSVRVLQDMDNMARALDEAEKGAGFPFDTERAAYLAKMHEDFPRRLENARKQAGAGPNADFNHNQALFVATMEYLRMTGDLLSSGQGLHSDWAFWGACLGLDTPSYALALANEWKGIREKLDRPLDRIFSANSRMLTLLGLPFDEYSMGQNQATKDHPADTKAVCAEWERLLEVLTGKTEVHLRRFNAHYDSACWRLLSWADRQILEGYLYGNRTLKHVWKIKNETTVNLPGKGTMTWTAMQLQSVNVYYHVLDKQWVFRQPSMAKQGYQTEKQMDEGILQGQRDLVKSSCARVERQPDLTALTEEQYQEYLAAIEARMRGDIDAKLEFKPTCEGEIGPVTLEISGLGKGGLTWKVKHGGANLQVAADIGEGGPVGRVTGGSVQTGISVEGGEGVVGSVDISVGGKQEAGGETEAVVEIKGKLGVGLEEEGIGGVACYPGSASMTWNARAFADQAWEYVQAEAAHSARLPEPEVQTGGFAGRFRPGVAPSRPFLPRALYFSGKVENGKKLFPGMNDFKTEI